VIGRRAGRLLPAIAIGCSGLALGGTHPARAQGVARAALPPDSVAHPPAPLVKTPAVVRGLYVNRWAATGTKVWQLIGLAKTTEVNALVIDVKDDRGLVLYRSRVALAHEIGADTVGPLTGARVRALLSEGDAAEALYRESITRLRRTRVRVELARGHLLYGEWLRRERRRLDAREQLRTAHELLVAIGMEAFAERARQELQATGEKVRKRTVDTRDDLTAQERLIARLARDGLSNPEIGARLFLSPRTVEWHLRNVFTKLGIQSRRGLANALAGPGSRLAPA